MATEWVVQHLLWKRVVYVKPYELSNPLACPQLGRGWGFSNTEEESHDVTTHPLYVITLWYLTTNIRK